MEPLEQVNTADSKVNELKGVSPAEDIVTSTSVTSASDDGK